MKGLGGLITVIVVILLVAKGCASLDKEAKQDQKIKFAQASAVLSPTLKRCLEKADVETQGGANRYMAEVSVGMRPDRGFLNNMKGAYLENRDRVSFICPEMIAHVDTAMTYLYHYKDESNQAEMVAGVARSQIIQTIPQPFIPHKEDPRNDPRQ